LQKAELTCEADSETMYYIGLDVHKRTISYCVKDAAGCVHMRGKIGSTRRELDAWSKTLPQPRTIAMNLRPLALPDSTSIPSPPTAHNLLRTSVSNQLEIRRCVFTL
jgi:hypothetical protein